MSDTLYIVVPCYNEEAALPLFYREITRVAGEMDYVDFEFIFIDDGSKDNTLPELRRLTAGHDPFDKGGAHYVRLCHYPKHAVSLGVALHFITQFIEAL